MRYFIGLLIKGEAGLYHKKLVEKICGELDTRNLNKYVSAHFTLKSPFETGDISEVEKVIRDFCGNEKSSNIKIAGIGNFDEKIIFLDGKPSDEAEGVFRRLILELRKFEWMKFRDYEFTDVNFHATLARSQNKDEFIEIRKLLPCEDPQFNVRFDNIAIFQHDNNRWKVYREFVLK